MPRWIAIYIALIIGSHVETYQLYERIIYGVIIILLMIDFKKGTSHKNKIKKEG